jgi:hypothetical protein
MKHKLSTHTSRKFLVVLLTTTALASILSCSLPEEPEKHALVYGISIYNTNLSEGTYPNLSATDNDAADMANLLESQGWTVKSGIANTQVHADNLDASRTAMEEDIAALTGSTGPVLFYYSGHGSRSYYGESCILPYGSLSNYGEWITVTELYSMFDSAGLKNVIVILDSCHSGGFVDEYSSVDAVPDIYDADGSIEPDGVIAYSWFVDSLTDSIKGYLRYETGSRYVSISAAGAGELSWESSTYGNGIFTYHVLKSATDPVADIDGDGYISSGELYSYCSIKIMESWNADYSEDYVDVYGDLQFADFHPHVSGSAREYVLWATQ